MSLTRDAVQGFIDGYNKANGNPTLLQTNLADWMTNHPSYPQSASDKAIILDSLPSYRVGVIKNAGV